MSKRNAHNPGGGSGIPNPAKKFYEWKGGKWTYYDKEKKERFSIPATDMSFSVLDEFNGVTGFSDRDQKGYWSTEARPGDPLKVYMGDRVVGEGVWKDVKGMNPDFKFQKILYVMTKFNGEPEIARIGLSGSSFGPWLELTTGKNSAKEKIGEPVNPQGDIAITVSGVVDGKKGSVVYQSPVFKAVPIKKETATEADDAFEIVEEFFNAKKQDNHQEDTSTDEAEDASPDMADKDLPF